MVSHQAKEVDVQEAIAEIDDLDVVGEKTGLIRIEDEQLD